MQFIEWLKEVLKSTPSQDRSFSGGYSEMFKEKCCAGCSKKVPEMFQYGTFVSGLPFGKCKKCGRIWCYNCDSRRKLGDLIYHECPRCHVTFSTWL